MKKKTFLFSKGFWIKETAWSVKKVKFFSSDLEFINEGMWFCQLASLLFVFQLPSVYKVLFKNSHGDSLSIELEQGWSLPACTPQRCLFVNKALLKHGHAHFVSVVYGCFHTGMAALTWRPCGPHSPQTLLSVCLQKGRQLRSGRAPVSHAWPSSKRWEGRTFPHHQFCSVFVFGPCRAFTAVNGLSCPAARGILVPRPGIQLIVEVWGATQPLPRHTCPPGCLLEALLWGLRSLAGACPQNTPSWGSLFCGAQLTRPVFPKKGWKPPRLDREEGYRSPSVACGLYTKIRT